jgi:hypothetical protein
LDLLVYRGDSLQIEANQLGGARLARLQQLAAAESRESEGIEGHTR